MSKPKHVAEEAQERTVWLLDALVLATELPNADTLRALKVAIGRLEEIQVRVGHHIACLPDGEEKSLALQLASGSEYVLGGARVGLEVLRLKTGIASDALNGHTPARGQA